VASLGGPADDDEDDVQNERCNGDVVEEQGRLSIRRKLVCSPEQKGKSQ
jgi:hypothetical protein